MLNIPVRLAFYIGYHKRRFLAKNSCFFADFFLNGIGGTPPPLNGKSLCPKTLNGKGGYPPPLNGKNPLKRF